MFKQEFPKNIMSIANTQEKEQEKLLCKSNVVGVGIGPKFVDGKETDELSLSVYVTSKMDPSLLDKDDLVPKSFGKLKTDIVEVGNIFAQSDCHTKKKSQTC